MVDAHQVQDGGVDVVAVGLALGGTPGPRVAFAVRDAGLHTGPGEPRHRGARVVIAARRTLRERLPAELRTPDQERVREHPAIVQVLKQRRGRPIHLARDRRQFFENVRVVVPVIARPSGPAPDLHETHAAFQ